VDPSGSYFSWKASAIGKNVSNAKTFLEKRYTDDMELEDAIHTAILTLKEGFEGQISGKNIEIGIVDASRKFRLVSILSPSFFFPLHTFSSLEEVGYIHSCQLLNLNGVFQEVENIQSLEVCPAWF
jgi:hypothetical protein